jgi:hypothetical protein
MEIMAFWGIGHWALGMLYIIPGRRIRIGAHNTRKEELRGLLYSINSIINPLPLLCSSLCSTALVLCSPCPIKLSCPPMQPSCLCSPHIYTALAFVQAPHLCSPCPVQPSHLCSPRICAGPAFMQPLSCAALTFMQRSHCAALVYQARGLYKCEGCITARAV